MSAHGKENEKGAEPDWAGLSWDADGQTGNGAASGSEK